MTPPSSSGSDSTHKERNAPLHVPRQRSHWAPPPQSPPEPCEATQAPQLAAATRCPAAPSQGPALLPDKHQPTARRLNFLVFWQAGAGLVLAKQRQLSA